MTQHRVPSCGRHLGKFDDVTIYPVLVVARTVCLSSDKYIVCWPFKLKILIMMFFLILCYDKFSPLTAHSFPQFDVGSLGNDILIIIMARFTFNYQNF